MAFLDRENFFFSGSHQGPEESSTMSDPSDIQGRKANPTDLVALSTHPCSTAMSTTEPLEVKEPQPSVDPETPANARIPSASRGTSILTWLLHRPPLFAACQV